MNIRVTVAHRGSIAADILSDARIKLIELHTSVVRKSPVDTGNFRAAWTVDTTALSLENNSEYAEALAKGHSPQAPDGWIDDSITDIFR